MLPFMWSGGGSRIGHLASETLLMQWVLVAEATNSNRQGTWAAMILIVLPRVIFGTRSAISIVGTLENRGGALPRVPLRTRSQRHPRVEDLKWNLVS